MNIERVRIKWVDSWGVNPSWESKEEAIEHKTCLIWTSGYLIKETEEAKLSSEEIADKLELAKLSNEQAENKLEIASSIEFEENDLLLTTKNALYSLNKGKAQLTNLIDTLQQSLR